MVKPILFLLPLLLAINIHLHAQLGWAYLKGQPSNINMSSIGKGLPQHNNQPGYRLNRYVYTWIGGSKLYMHGSRVGWSNHYENTDNIWSYDTVNGQWTFEQGEYLNSINGSYPAVYGVKGVADSNNTPGSNVNGIVWHANGKTYLHGGSNAASGTAIMWMYDSTTRYWTWIHGDTANSNAIFGQKGIAAINNTPAYYRSLFSYVYGGNLYLIDEYINIWKYDIVNNMWTWLKGYGTAKITASQGTKGIADSSNYPGPHTSYELDPIFWSKGNKIYLHTGLMWEYDLLTNNWTWIAGDLYPTEPIYGKKNVPDSTNNPARRNSSAAWEYDGKLYLYGGTVDKLSAPTRSDLWEFDLFTLKWSWTEGPTITEEKAHFGSLKHGDIYTTPGAVKDPMQWQVGNKVYMMIGMVLWRFNIDTKIWTWVSGLPYYEYGTSHIENVQTDHNLNMPYIIEEPLWESDSMIYYYSRSWTPYNAYQNIMWQYDIDKNTWTTLRVYQGANSNYGTKGVAGTDTRPYAREGASCWYLNGKLYLYDGEKQYKKDMWEYDLTTNNWRWLKGDSVQASSAWPIYGMQGIPDSNNTPGTRYNTITWTYNNKLYLYGGRWSANERDVYSQVWEYDPATNNWTWIHGSTSMRPTPVYGTKGVFATTNLPGGRAESHSCVINNSLYIYGGTAYGESFSSSAARYGTNDLWEYNMSQNTWRFLDGSKTNDPVANFGTKGIANANNTPGGRMGAIMQAYNNNLYIVGGDVVIQNFVTIRRKLQDVWKYDLNTNNWIWIAGEKADTILGYYDQPYTFNNNYNIGSIQNSFFDYKRTVSWRHQNRVYKVNPGAPANIYQYGKWVGIGAYTLWSYDLCEDPSICYANAPVVDIDSVLTLCSNTPLEINAGNIGSRFLWSNGDITYRTVITTTGKHWVRVTNPANKTTTDTFTVMSAMSPVIKLVEDTVICSNDSIRLDATIAGGQYSWSTGDTTPFIYAKKQDIYTVHVLDKNGCYAKATTNLKTKEAPSKISLSSNGPLCVGQSIKMEDSVLIWHNGTKRGVYGPKGYIGQSLSILTSTTADSGIYYVIDTLNGCIESDTISISVFENFKPEVTVTTMPGHNAWPYVPLVFKANMKYDSAHTTYQWYKNNTLLTGETKSSYTAIAQTDIKTNDTICVRVKNSNVCAYLSTGSDCEQPIIIRLSVNDGVTKNGITVHPNPFAESLTINGLNGTSNIEVYDISGRMIYQNKVALKQLTIPTNEWPSGNYLLNVTENNLNTISIKVVKE